MERSVNDKFNPRITLHYTGYGNNGVGGPLGFSLGVITASAINTGLQNAEVRLNNGDIAIVERAFNRGNYTT